MTGFAMALGVAIGVLMLAWVQWRSILRWGEREERQISLSQVCSCSQRHSPPTPSNMTEIESWIVEKAERRERKKPFIYPYDFGYRENFRWGGGWEGEREVVAEEEPTFPPPPASSSSSRWRGTA